MPPNARALVHRAFVDLRVREVVATTMAVNTGSRRVLAKDPLEGSEHGDVEYRLARQDWSG